MTLRHIKPGTPEWEEVVAAERLRGGAGHMLTPEETVRLRTLVAVEQSQQMWEAQRSRT